MAVSRRQALRSALSRVRTEAALSGKVLERLKVLVAAGATGVAVGALLGAAAPLAMGGAAGLVGGGCAGVGHAFGTVVAAASGKTAVALGAAAGGVLGGSVGALVGAEAPGPREAALEALQQVGAMGVAVVGVAAGMGVAAGVGGAVGAGGAVRAALEGGAVSAGVASSSSTARLLTEMGRAVVGIALAGGLVIRVVKERVRSANGHQERNSYEIYWNK